MADERDVALTFVVSLYLGMYGKALSGMESQIDRSIAIVADRSIDDPENSAIPLMMGLLVAAKDLIKAHKAIERSAEMAMSGTMMHEGTQRLQ